MMGYIVIGIILLLLFFVMHHQRRLHTRAHLMREAIRNRDFQFRLPTDGLLPGERAMQEVLNQLGDVIRQQTRRSEVESWERLTRVLTHEIMNATAPIASLSQSMLTRPEVVGTPLEEGIGAIHQTANRLSTFVDSYRKFSQLQSPRPEDVQLSKIVLEIQALYTDVEWTTEIDEALHVRTDPVLLRQILINLVKNAIEAGAKRVTIKSPLQTSPHDGGGFSHPGSRPIMEEGWRGSLLISNDGLPIPAENRSSIFVPFFTTKRDGSGIGLSLSRRIMTLQGGDLELTDAAQTTFKLTF